MASDNKVSSFLLLILIGFAIYYLFNIDGFNSINKLTNNLHEGFDDNESNFNQFETQHSESHNENNPNYESYEVPDEQQNNNLQIKYEENNEPYIPQSVINDVAVNSIEPFESIDSSDLMASHNDMNDTNDASDAHLLNANIYNFQPNDETGLDVIGSNLNDAFALPIPNGAQTDAIDFKKQNVDNYNARDFLPREVNDEWFETDFSLAKYQLNDDKLINTEKYIIGINTVGQSLKNASWDIRGTIPNPKLVVSPWNNSTYEPDFNLKPLC